MKKEKSKKEKLTKNKLRDLRISHIIQVINKKKLMFNEHQYSRTGVLEKKNCLFFIKELVEKNEFDWENDSILIINHFPSLFDKKKFNWYQHSKELIKKRPALFDSAKFNWFNNSLDLLEWAPHLIDKNKLNWAQVSNSFFEKLSPYWIEKIFDPDDFNWELGSGSFISYKDEKFVRKYFDKKKYNWKNNSKTILGSIYEDLIDWELFSFKDATEKIIRLKRLDLVNEKFDYVVGNYGLLQIDADLAKPWLIRFDAYRENWMTGFPTCFYKVEHKYWVFSSHIKNLKAFTNFVFKKKLVIDIDYLESIHD